MALTFELRQPRRDFLLELRAEFNRQTTGIYGPSGSGKTSFFRLLAGLEKPESGRILLNGRILTDSAQNIFVKPQNRRIGFVFQERLLFPHLTVEKNIRFGTRYVPENRVSFDEVVDLLDLRTLLGAYPGEISGGEQQRTAIARALLASPELLLMDEPFNAIDNSLRLSILPYIRRLRDHWDIPLLVISHDLADLQQITDTFFLIEKGRCPAHGPLWEVLEDEHSRKLLSGYVNTIRLADPRKQPDGLTVCRAEGTDQSLEITVPGNGQQRFTALLSPDDIALSKRAIKNISIQNQIKGTLTRIIEDEMFVLCHVDIGINLTVKITTTAFRQMKLDEGDSVYALFKAHSLVVPVTANGKYSISDG